MAKPKDALEFITPIDLCRTILKDAFELLASAYTPTDGTSYRLRVDITNEALAKELLWQHKMVGVTTIEVAPEYEADEWSLHRMDALGEQVIWSPGV